MEVVKGVAQVMGPVLVSRVTAVMTLLDRHSGLANRAESGVESNLDAFVSTFMRLFSLTVSLAQLPHQGVQFPYQFHHDYHFIFMITGVH